MTQKQIAALSLKLLGIFSIIEAIPLLREFSQVFAWRGSKIEMESGPLHTDLLLIGIMISFGLLMIIGLCLIGFSGAIAKRMVDNKEIASAMTELTAKNIQSVAFSIIGLVLIVIAIPHLVQLIANLQALKSAKAESVKESIAIGTWAYSIGLTVQFIIGIVLFLGGRGLSSLWFLIQRMRPMKDM